ncbi:hypothetical protein XBLMG947_0068 [Xanthomonas bromi]|uniref:Uncharacterized protein n=1 Tax=Xanthomonas bromi TaxID=56449 RepID=A0A1C3NG09_9XANT|nr:hypothetical protein XBLMG947_0068 [Xanthomonas bromi]
MIAFLEDEDTTSGIGGWLFKSYAPDHLNWSLHIQRRGTLRGIHARPSTECSPALH